MRGNGRLRRERISLLSRYSADLGQCVSRERSERALHAAAIEQAMASRAKSEFLANMSHELRTPLNAIIGFSDLIGQPVAGASAAAKVGEYATLINRAGKHLLGIISDILDISKIESGTFALDVEPQSLREARLYNSPSRREMSCSPAEPSGRQSLSLTRPLALRGGAMTRGVAAGGGVRDSAT